MICNDSQISIRRQCELLTVNRSGIYKPKRPALAAKALCQKIRDISKRNVHYGRKHRVQIPDKYRIANRPEIINSRTEFGHFEGDLTFMKGSKSANLLVLIERVTRKSFILENNNKKAISTMNKIYNTLSYLPSNILKSITFDNGSEFKRFGCLSFLDTKVYFCDPASPWQKGQGERLNAQLHKYIPKTSDIRSVTKSQVLDTQDKLNNLPRKVLGFLTPNEA